MQFHPRKWWREEEETALCAMSKLLGSYITKVTKKPKDALANRRDLSYFSTLVWYMVFVFLHPSAALFIVSEITDQANDSMLQAVSPTMTHAPLISSVFCACLFKWIHMSVKFWSLLQGQTQGLIQIWFTILQIWSWSMPFSAAVQDARNYSQ